MMYSRICSYLPLVCAVAIIAPLLIFTPSTTHGQVLIPSTVVNCTIYNSSLPCLPGDRSLFCLTNGTTVRGICDAQKAVCEENAEIADSMAPCTFLPTQPPNNTAISFMTTNSKHLFYSTHLQLIFSSSLLICIWLAYRP